jgi:hypothetical protein
VHGIIRERNLKESSGPSSYTNIRRVEVRYSDATSMRFVAEAGREFFQQDDMHQMVELFNATAETAEWSEYYA